MTQKELLYIEDALGHVQTMKTTFNSLAAQLKDSDLKSFVQSLADQNGQSFSKFYSLIG